MVKVRLVRLGSGGTPAGRAHLRYIQRDGVAEDGTAGQLYSADQDCADGRAFLERSAGDRHQFRFIVSAEDGDQYDDLRPLIRRAMRQMEQDLGTGLEWIAADHRDTLHPHTHIIIRGKDERGENLVIAREYLSHGFRERVAELVSLDLGPQTELEIQTRLRQESTAERLTSLDRRLLRELDPERGVTATGRNPADTALRAGRLRKLEQLGLAEQTGSGRWRLVDRLEERLIALGERGDIIRTMQRALSARGLARAPAEQLIHADPLIEPLVGRVIGRGLADEHRDRQYLLVDGVDGRVHHLVIGDGNAVELLAAGTIIRVSAETAAVRPVDGTLAEVAAANDGQYSEALHRAHDPRASPEFVRAHVRRLEAIRRDVGGPERDAEGTWQIGQDHLARAAAHEERRIARRPLRVEVLSALPLHALPEAGGATWLDRELAKASPEPLREAGFGAEVRAAKVLRQRWLVARELATEKEGGWAPRPNMLAVLRQRELFAAAAKLQQEFGLPARAGEDGQRVGGVLLRRVDLASGRFAVLQGAGELILVPWRPELARQLGRELSGRVGPEGFSWSRARSRGIEVG